MKRVIEENINEAGNWQALYERQGPTRRTAWNNREFQKDLSAVIPTGASVLDVAAGPGLAELAMVSRFGRSDITWSGTDFSPYIAAWALERSGVKWVDYFVNDVRDGLPVADGAYDVVMATELLEHLDRPAAAVAEFARAARRRIILTTPLTKVSHNLAERDSSPYHVWAIWPEDLVNLLKPHGKAWAKITRTGRTILAVCDIER